MAKSKKEAIKYGVLVALALGIGAVLWMGKDEGIDTDYDESDMMKLYGPAKVQTDNGTNKGGVQQSNVAEIDVQSKPKEQAEPEFVLSRDYRTVIAAEKMISMALNEDVTAAWEGLRLAANAKREKANIALLEMQEAKAKFDKAKYEQQTEAVQSGKLRFSEEGDVLIGAQQTRASSNSNIELRGYVGSKGERPSSVILVVNGKQYSNVVEGQTVSDFFIADLNDKTQCVVVGTGSVSDPMTQNLCI